MCPSSVLSRRERFQEDDIIAKLKEQLPSEQMNMIADSKEEFQILLSKQRNFKPYGELISKLVIGGAFLPMM